nr:unnamed protein product [Spirometra erinaceieuropaei]
MFVDLGSDRVLSGRFPAGQRLHGPDGFVERGQEVKVGVSLHLRSTGDTGVGDGGWTVEDSFEVLDPSLKNSCLLGEQDNAVSAENRSSTIGCGTVDSLDRNEEVVPFVVPSKRPAQGGVGFMKAFLLGEQVADGDVVIKSVLVYGNVGDVNDCFSELNCDVAMFAGDFKLWSVILTEFDEERLQANLNRREE